MLDMTRDPTTISPAEAQSIVLEIRSRVAASQEVSDDELRYGVRLISVLRSGSVAARNAEKAASGTGGGRTKKAAVSLDAF